MFDPDSRRESLRNFSGVQEIVRFFLHSRDLFLCIFGSKPKMHVPFRKEAKTYEKSSIVRRLFS